MRSSLARQTVESHRNTLEQGRSITAKADLKNLDDQWKARTGEAFSKCIKLAGLTAKEAGALLNKDAGAISRWCAGTENVQTWAILQCDQLRGPWVIAQAQMCAEIEVETTIRIRRSA